MGYRHDIQPLFRVAALAHLVSRSRGAGHPGQFPAGPHGKGTVDNETEAIGWRQVTMNQQDPAASLDQVNGSLLLPPVAPLQDEEADDTSGTAGMDAPGAFTLAVVITALSVSCKAADNNTP